MPFQIKKQKPDVLKKRIYQSLWGTPSKSQLFSTRTKTLYPQFDGIVECMNRMMGKRLSKVVSHHKRDDVAVN